MPRYWFVGSFLLIVTLRTCKARCVRLFLLNPILVLHCDRLGTLKSGRIPGPPHLHAWLRVASLIGPTQVFDGPPGRAAGRFNVANVATDTRLGSEARSQRTKSELHAWRTFHDACTYLSRYLGMLYLQLQPRNRDYTLQKELLSYMFVYCSLHMASDLVSRRNGNQ